MTTGRLSEPQLGDATIRELRDALAGELIESADDAYDAARAVWNGMIDRRPALIARCADADDVATAVRFGRSEGLAVAVRGGAHNVAGNATCDGGLVIDLSPMKGIRVDPQARTVRAQGGLTWGELDAATQAHGLATTGGLVSTTGVAGFTLGGGIGWMMRKHGLACDNLVGADVVTADGRALRASESEHAELLWGLRGGGGNFGVVTEFEFRLHPVATVLGGMVAWPAEHAGDVLRFWREWVRDTPDELCTMAVFLYAPPEPFVPPEVQGTPIVAIAACHLDREATEDLRALREFGPPAVDVIGPLPYTALQGMFDGGAPAGMRNYWKSAYVAELSDAAIDTILAHTSGIPAAFGQVHLHQLGGAMSRVPSGATAFGNRDAGFLMNLVGMWPDPADDERHTAWTRAFAGAMEPHGTGRAYVNFMGEEGEARVRAAYEPETFARLRSLKASYDPTNFFRLNQNVPPR
jgi:FAD/FMN-containing dehydrogenase